MLMSGLIGFAQQENPLTRFTGQGITVAAKLAQGKFGGLEVTDEIASRSVELPEAFTVVMKDGTTLRSSQMPMRIATPATADVSGDRICADFSGGATDGSYRWCLVMRPRAHYFRQTLAIRAESQDLPIREIRLLDFHDPGAHVEGRVKGSPVVDARMFFGFEHPLSDSSVREGHVVASLFQQLPLRAGQSEEYSSVVGVAAAGQMRRAFLAYIEAERPRPYRQFLHYNSWYDLGAGQRYDEAGVIDRVNAFGTELVRKRHVELDSFLFDDGWDNPGSLWGFNSGFPNALTRVAAEAQKYNAGIGVWLSPWGGYGDEKVQRIAYGRNHGYEIINDGYALSGPRYYAAFKKTCFAMIDRYGVNQFKFDGTGNADRVFPGSEFDSDFDAAIHLIRSIRQHKPGIFINLTTGTYPSPFWLFYADSIWPGGDDHSFAGVGSSRDRWITYREQETYRNIVLAGPLFPLNSLMLHGLIYAQFAEGLKTDPDNDFPAEVQSCFGSGTQLEEMYITPSLLSDANWDAIARAALWARRRSAILEDSHWVGGDPGKLDVYGWAAWNPAGWIVTLRNPSNMAQDFSLQLAAALQLPQGAAESYQVHNPFGQPGESTTQWHAHRTVSIHLKPFEVKTFESIARADG
jgi:hypothetical protein